MLELWTIITHEDSTGTTYFIVTKTGTHTVLEKLDDFIMRNRVVQTSDVYRTLKEILEDEKREILRKGVIDVPDN